MPIMGDIERRIKLSSIAYLFFVSTQHDIINLHYFVTCDIIYFLYFRRISPCADSKIGDLTTVVRLLPRSVYSSWSISSKNQTPAFTHAYKTELSCEVLFHVVCTSWRNTVIGGLTQRVGCCPIISHQFSKVIIYNSST